MMREPNKRPRRNPLTSEEVANIIAHKKRLELTTLYKLKKTRAYKLMNIFNVGCIFIYLELVLCYFGPCHYQKHCSLDTIVTHGNKWLNSNQPIISDIDIYGVNGRVYKFIVEDFIDAPARRICFVIGKDFLLQKELKGMLESSGQAYRLFSASPVLLLSILVSVISFIAFLFNLNEKAYSLSGLTTINVLTLFGILMI
jgi:hypothetical protein